jgi:hypothetical protein
MHGETVKIKNSLVCLGSPCPLWKPMVHCFVHKILCNILLSVYKPISYSHVLFYSDSHECERNIHV